MKGERNSRHMNCNQTQSIIVFLEFLVLMLSKIEDIQDLLIHM